MLPGAEREFVAPSGPLEHQLTQIWEEVLGVEAVAIRDNFFELGGHSLLAVRMIEQIEQACGKRLPLTTLFTGATIEHIVNVLLQQESENCSPAVTEIQSGCSKRPFFFLHGDVDNGGLYCVNLARHLGAYQPFYALHP